MTLIDNAVYVDGRRSADPGSLEQTFELVGERNGMAWIGLYRPDVAEIRAVAREFELHRLTVDDAIAAHQRPKLERYGDTLFTVLRPASYLGGRQRVEFGELHIFTGPGFVVTIRYTDTPDLGRVRRRLERAPDLLRLGPEAVLYAVLDQVVDEYAPIVADLQAEIDAMEDQLFAGRPEVSRRIYELAREVIAFQRATQPLTAMLDGLAAGFDKYRVDLELQRGLRDVQDHTVRIVERVESFRTLLQNALTVNAALVGQQQNDEMRALTQASLTQNEEVKKISAWAAILFAPTLVGTIYGMNFTHMPELDWVLGYPFAVLLMICSATLFYWIFKRRRWL